MKCSDCGKHIKPIFRDGNDYFYHECDTCHQAVCESCSDEDDDGKVECLFCITDRLIKGEDKMECPKCHKALKLIKSRAGDFYSHSYTLAQVMSNKTICDYSKPVNK